MNPPLTLFISVFTTLLAIINGLEALQSHGLMVARRGYGLVSVREGPLPH